MTQVKCRYCGKSIDRDSAYKVGKSSYYCNETHYLNKQDESRNDIKYKATKGSDRRILTDYIVEIYLDAGYKKDEIPWNVLMQKTKQLMDKFGYKYSGIKLTLEYEREIRGLNLLDDRSNGICLNFIEYDYEFAKQNYIETKNIEQAIQDFDFEENIIVVKKGIEKGNKKWYNEINVDEI